MQTSAVQVFLAVINLILCTQRMPCENSLKTCIGSTLAVTILVLEVCPSCPSHHQEHCIWGTRSIERMPCPTLG